MTQPRTIDTLLAQYADSHRNPTNELIHFVCIPVIVFTLLGILWSIHPLAAVAAVVAALVYYLRLSRPFAFGMLLLSSVMLGILAMMPPMTVLPLSIAIFVLPGSGS